MSTASSSSAATWPLGTGTPWSPSRRLVRSLSPAISTPSWAVVDAMVAWILRWLTP